MVAAARPTDLPANHATYSTTDRSVATIPYLLHPCRSYAHDTLPVKAAPVRGDRRRGAAQACGRVGRVLRLDDHDRACELAASACELGLVVGLGGGGAG